MSTPKSLMWARKHVALNLARLLVLSSAMSALVLAQSGAASAAPVFFTPSVEYAAGAYPLTVAVGDFNGDGDPDLANINEGVGDLSVLLGGPGGTFGDPTHYAVGSYPQSVVIGDVNGDGDPDLVVPNADSNNVSVLLGGSGGTFADATNYPVVDYPTSVAIGDFNADGNPDLAVTGGHSYDVTILLGSSGGAFGSPTTMPAGDLPYSVAVGEFNHDSDPDLVIGNRGGTVSVLLGGPGATFGALTSYPTGTVDDLVISIVVGDFNHDSDPDLVVVNDGLGVDDGVDNGSVSVLLGDPGGAFGAPTAVQTSSYPRSVAVADFNADGDSDLAITDGDVGKVKVLLGGAGGSFGAPWAFATRGASIFVAAGDFNADSRPDLAVANYTSSYPAPTPETGGIAVLLNDPDLTPPDTTITTGPNGPTNDSTPTFGFTSSEAGSTFECRVDAGAFSACTTPRTTGVLGEGTHTFEVRAIDASDNVDPTSAIRTFTVDTVTPDTTITGGPDGLTSDDTPTFTFTSSEPGATFECRISAAFVPCTSPYTTDDLGVGDQTFQVRAKDAAGNQDATPAGRSFTIDQSPPTTSITSGPSGATGDSAPTFGFTSPDSDATFECRVDDAAFEACTTPHTTAQLDDGEHVFYVRAVDSVGNVDPIPAAGSFTVDTVAPDTTIGSGPTGIISDNTPSFSWDFADGALAYECRVDDKPFAACESPETTAPLSDGQHTFELRAIDGSGNIDPTPAGRTFTVDTEALVTGITAGPSGLTKDSTPTLSFATSDPGSAFECRVSPAGFEPCASPYTSAELTDGEHTFEVRSIDSVGNVESPPVGRTFTVDTSAPETTITTGPSGTTDDQTPTFGFSSPEAGATLECRVDSADFGPCTSPYTTTLLANGAHTFEARATDAAGNTDSSPASRTFTVSVDSAAPNTQIDSGPASLTNQVKPTFKFSANEPVTFECKLDAGSFVPCQSGDSFGPLGNGSHTFSVRATDLAGNVDPTPATRAWIVDTTPPQTTITSAPSWLSLSSRAKFGFTSSEGGSTFQCRLDSGAWQACTSPRTYTGVRLGNHSFAVRAIDPAGNTDPTPAEKTWFALVLLPL